MIEKLLPHFNDRQAPIDMLILHCTAHRYAEEAIDCLDKLELSAHYVMDYDGVLYRLVPEEKRAWHAGKGYWRGDADLNSRSVGIEICNTSLGQQPYTEKQIEKLIPFCQKIIRKYHIPPCNVTGHSDVAPLRKPDPGAAFPWKKLAREGIGLWYQPKNAVKMPENEVSSLLEIIGYDVRSDEALRASAYAFCRHFLPQYVQSDEDVCHLVEHIFPDNFDFMDEAVFLKTLKAVAFSYK